MKLSSDQIRILLIEKITGTIEPQDALRIDRLLEEDPAVRLQFAQIQASLIANGVEVNADADRAWLELQENMQPKKGKNTTLSRYLIAASLLGVLAIGIYFYPSRSTSKQIARQTETPQQDRLYLQTEKGEVFYLDSAHAALPVGFSLTSTASASPGLKFDASAPVQWNMLSVPRVLDYRLHLADGTEVILNSKTTLRFPNRFGGSHREVYLNGEAYFKVAKNAHQPFIVHAKGTDITVLGTEFNLNAYDSAAVNTSLVEGSVSASASSASIRLKPGMQAAYQGGGFHVVPFDPADVLSWMEGVHHFRNSSLVELSALLSRWYKVQVRFENEAAKRKTFSGEIAKSQPVELFLENLKLSNSINFDFNKGLITFR